MDDFSTAFLAAVAAELRVARARAGMTNEEIASRTGLSERSVIRYLQGDRDIPTSALRALCGALGVEASAIFDLAEKALE